MSLTRPRSIVILPTSRRRPPVTSNRFSQPLRLLPESTKRSKAFPTAGNSPSPRTKRRRLGDTFPLQAKLTDRLTPTSLKLTLPLPPSINHQYATVRGRRVLSSSGRRYKSEIAKLLFSVVSPSPNRQRFLGAVQSHSLKLSLHFHFPTLLRRDLDGGLKIAQDALCQALGINDNRIMEIHLLKSVDAALPRMECALSLLQPLARTRTPRKAVNSKS